MVFSPTGSSRSTPIHGEHMSISEGGQDGAGDQEEGTTLLIRLTNNPAVRIAHEPVAPPEVTIGNRKPTVKIQREFLDSALGGHKTVIRFHVTRRATVLLELERPSRAFIYLGIFFASLQVLDGVLTSVGVNQYGITKEGNPLLRTLMERFNPEQTLFMVKAIAVIVIAYMTLLAKRIRWVRDLIGLLSCIYLFGAILPWLWVLYLSQP